MKTIDLFNNNHKPYATPRIRIVQMELTSLLDATGEAPFVPSSGEWDAKRVKKIIVDEPEEEEQAPMGPFPYL